MYFRPIRGPNHTYPRHSSHTLFSSPAFVVVRLVHTSALASPLLPGLCTSLQRRGRHEFEQVEQRWQPLGDGRRGRVVGREGAEH
jgi:hypothetical protein